MIWLTWRQFRAQAVTAAAALAAFAVVLAATGLHLASLYASSGIPAATAACCGQLAGTFLQPAVEASPYPDVYLLGVAVILFAPAVIGVFWGAPLIARELETGTYRLAWTQSVTRTRWLAVKLTLMGLAAMAVTEALSLIQAWWAAPIGRAVGPGGGGPIARAGSAAGLRHPRHHPARLRRVRLRARRHRRGSSSAAPSRPWPSPWPSSPPSSSPRRCGSARTCSRPARRSPRSPRDAATHVGRPNCSSRQVVPGQPGAWIISSEAVNAAGQPVSTIPAACRAGRIAASGRRRASAAHCLASHGIRVAENYQPASHYWPLQWSETGMFLALALALAGYCFWRLNRRRT